MLEQLIAAGLPFKEEIFTRGSVLFSAGKACKELYWLENGALALGVDEGDDFQIIRLAYQSNWIVPLDSLIHGGESVYSIIALRKSKVLRCPVASFKALLATSEALQSVWTNVLGQLVLDSLSREIDLLELDPLVRYRRVFDRSPQLFQEVPHKYIASYLRMTPETLSRLLKS